MGTVYTFQVYYGWRQQTKATNLVTMCVSLPTRATNHSVFPYLNKNNINHQHKYIQIKQITFNQLKFLGKFQVKKFWVFLKLGYIGAFQANTEGEKTDYSQSFHLHLFYGVISWFQERFKKEAVDKTDNSKTAVWV